MTFLYESWYCAGWSADLGDEPKRITILGQELALFRDGEGVPHAIPNRCSHRFAPLFMGKVVNGNLECPYHGLQFDGSGACVVNPHGSNIIPPRAHLRSYPLIEKHRAIWVWMGDPANADPSTIIPLTFMDDERYAVATGYLHVKAGYRLLNDNLLDLTHAAFIHTTTVGYSRDILYQATGMQWDVSAEGNVVHSNYAARGVPATAQYLGLFGPGIGDSYVYVTWYPASSMIVDLSMAPCGAPKPQIEAPTNDAVLIPGAHLIVPETDGTCHYFYAQTRSADIYNEDKNREMLELADYTFLHEDAVMIEESYRLMGGEDFNEIRPAILETDQAGMQARRVLEKLIKDRLTAVDRGTQ